MKNHSIVIAERDMERLSRLIRGAQHSLLRDQQQVDLLDHVLQSADVRPFDRMPKSVVRLDSRVQVRDIETRRQELYTLVFPDKANASLGLISVLAPIGIALIGQRKGASIEAMVPGRIRRLRILHVSQSPVSSFEKPHPASRPVTPRGLVVEEGLAA